MLHCADSRPPQWFSFPQQHGFRGEARRVGPVLTASLIVRGGPGQHTTARPTRTFAFVSDKHKINLNASDRRERFFSPKVSCTSVANIATSRTFDRTSGFERFGEPYNFWTKFNEVRLFQQTCPTSKNVFFFFSNLGKVECCLF